MKFLCVPCDSPMKLQTVSPPERGSLSVVYSCPECGYEIAMLTNAYETQVVQSLGVKIGPSSWLAAEPRCRFSGGGHGRWQVSVRRDDSRDSGRATRQTRTDARPLDCRRGSEAREHSRIRPPDGANRHREVRAGSRSARSRREDPRRRPRLLRHVIERRGMPTNSADREHLRLRLRVAPISPGPTSSPGTSPTAAISPASTAIWTPARGRRSAPRTSPIGASSALRNATRSSTRSPPSPLSA